MIWPRVNKLNPCPICGKSDWCQLGDRAIKCMRVESNRPSADGGWYHPYGDSHQVHNLIKMHEPPPRFTPNFLTLCNQWSSNTCLVDFNDFSDMLGVHPVSLFSLRACRARQYDVDDLHAWAFPMRDADELVIGIRLRNPQKKWAVMGSRNGLFIPVGAELCERLWVCEGPTDTAAALSLGLLAIGRPACTIGDDMVADYVRRIGFKEVVIISDNDETQVRGQFVSPGVTGALKLQKALRCKTAIFMPPTKDIREYVIKGGTREGIDALVGQMKWRKEK